MTKVAVVGAGRLGSTIAFSIAKEGNAHELVIIDIIENLVRGEALDLGQTTLLRVEGSTDYRSMAGSDLVVIVAGIARKPDMTREQLLGTNARIMQSIIGQVLIHAPDTLILVVSNPMDAMTYIALKESGFPPHRVFGMGGVVDSNRFRYFLADEFHVHPDNVRATVVGQHGEIMIPLTGSVRIDGIENPDPARIARAIERTRDAGREVISLKGATFYAPAHAASVMVRAVLRDERQTLPSSVLIPGEEVCLGTPVILGREGVVEVMTPGMTREESRQWRDAIQALRENLEGIGY